MSNLSKRNEADLDFPEKTVSDGEASLVDNVRQGFDAAFYLSHYRDVADAGVDPFQHYMSSGWRENRRPNGWFKPQEYAARHPELVGSDINPFVHFLEHKDTKASELKEELARLRENRFLYWADTTVDIDGLSHPVIMSAELPKKQDLEAARGSFDAEYYLEQNPDVRKRGVDPFLHFMTIGWIEHRDPCPEFSVSFYLENNGDIRRTRLNPFVHYVRHGRHEAWRKSATVAHAKVLALFETDEVMAARVRQAKQLEPMVAMPNAPRRITSPLIDLDAVSKVAQSLREKLSGKQYRYIVAVPHVRMSGASRVASIFTESLSRLCDPSDILVVTTDSSENEYMAWFSGEVDVFDLSREITGLGLEVKVRLLIDLMRGVNCQTIVNVNSRLVWEAMRLFGRQVHNEFRVVTYLFTWDENPKGDRVGYPIQWLRDTADHHHLLLTDTQNLADDVSSRLGFGHLATGGQVQPLYTPIEQSQMKAARPRRTYGAGHFLWAGRFDPQKRLDILVAIARANPDMTFDVYGKLVLGNKDLNSYNPPENIIYKGTYTDLNEVLETQYSGFLYTSQWDGIPTILLDMAAAGLPIVAPNVGGIAEFMDNQKGWLIEAFDDVDGYSEALKHMARDPKEAATRAQALQARMADDFTYEHYTNNIENMVKIYGL